MSSARLPSCDDPQPDMRKIDRPDWTASMAFRSYGLRIGIRTNCPEAMPAIRKCLPPGWRSIRGSRVDHLFSVRVGSEKAGAKSRNFGVLYQGATIRIQTVGQKPLMDALEDCLQMCVAEWSPNRVFIHAGVVGWRGRAIVVPGRSMSGKSTLVAELLRAGATYYSDEYAVLDERGKVHAYPRRLSLRQPEGKPPLRCSAAELGSPTGRKPLPVGWVVVAKYLPGAHWQPRLLTPGRALLELWNHAVPALVKPEAVLKTLHQVVPGARALQGIRGEAGETVQALLREINGVPVGGASRRAA